MTAELFLRPLFDWRSAVASPFGPGAPTTRHVLLTLSLHMSPRGDSCFPSIELLVEESGLSRRAIIEHLKLAESAGWIAKQERPEKNGQGWRRLEYFPMIPEGIEAQVNSWSLERSARRAPRRGGAPHAEGGARGAQKVVHHVHPSKPVELTKENTVSEGGQAAPAERPEKGKNPKEPGAVAHAFGLYSDGMKAKYGAPYPPSAKANGQLAQVVKRIGAEATLAIVPWFLASTDPYYAKTKYRLESLVRDCEQLWMALQARSGGAAERPPTQARCYMAWSTKDTRAELDPQPIGEPLEIARRMARTYSRGITIRKADYIDVQIGTANHRYAIAELTQPQGARP